MIHVFVHTRTGSPEALGVYFDAMRAAKALVRRDATAIIISHDGRELNSVDYMASELSMGRAITSAGVYAERMTPVEVK